MSTITVDLSLMNGNPDPNVQKIAASPNNWAQNINNAPFVVANSASLIGNVTFVVVPQNQFSSYITPYTSSASTDKVYYAYLDTNQQYYNGISGSKIVSVADPAYGVINHELLHAMGLDHNDDQSTSQFIADENSLNQYFDPNLSPRIMYGYYPAPISGSGTVPSNAPNHEPGSADPPPLGGVSVPPPGNYFGSQQNFTGASQIDYGNGDGLSPSVIGPSGAAYDLGGGSSVFVSGGQIVATLQDHGDGTATIYGNTPGTPLSVSGTAGPVTFDSSGNVSIPFSVGSGITTVTLSPTTGGVSAPNATNATATVGSQTISLITPTDGTKPFAVIFGTTEAGASSSNDGIEEPDTRDVLVDGGDRQAATRQFEAVEAKVLRRRLVGGAVDELGEALDAVDIGPLGLGREAARGHVVDQALAKRADGLVGHWNLLAWVETGESSSSSQEVARRYIQGTGTSDGLQPLTWFGCAAICRVLLIGTIGIVSMSITAARASEDEGAFGKEVRVIEFPDRIRTLAWSHNQRFIVVSNEVGNRVSLYDLDRDETRWTVKKGGLMHEGLAFSADDRFLAAGPIDGGGGQRWEATIGLVNVETGTAHNLLEPVQMTPEGKIADSNHAVSIAASADGKAVVALLGERGRIYVYDTATWQVSQRIGPVLTEARKAAPNGHLAIDAGRDIVVYADHGRLTNAGFVDSWKLSANMRINSFSAYEVGMNYMLLDPMSGNLITGSGATTIGVPDPKQPGHLTEKQDDPLTAVRAWNPLTGERVETYPGPGEGVGSLAVSPNGRYLAATKGSGLIPAYLIVWDLQSGARLAVRAFGKDHWVESVAFSSDGRRLAYAIDNEVHILEFDPDTFR